VELQKIKNQQFSEMCEFSEKFVGDEANVRKSGNARLVPNTLKVPGGTAKGEGLCC
jgi:hypothetical protein